MGKTLAVALGVALCTLSFLFTGKGFCTPILDDNPAIWDDDIWVLSPHGVAHFDISDIISTGTNELLFAPIQHNSSSTWIHYSLWIDTNINTSFPIGVMEVTYPNLSFIGGELPGFTLRFDGCYDRCCFGHAIIVSKETTEDSVSPAPEASTLLLFGLGLLGLLTSVRRLIRRRKSRL